MDGRLQGLVTGRGLLLSAVVGGWVVTSSLAVGIGGGVVLPPWLRVYEEGFQAGAGAEWSSNGTSTTPSGRRFLGQFDNARVDLRVPWQVDATLGASSAASGLELPLLPPHTEARVRLSLFVIQSWDGNDPRPNPPPEVWNLTADGATLKQTNFCHTIFTQAFPGDYPGAANPCRTGANETNTLGFGSGFFGDSVYNLTFTFPHSSPSLILRFVAAGLEGIGNESWGLDDVVVEVRVSPGAP